MGFPGKRYPALDPVNILELRDAIRVAKERYSRRMEEGGLKLDALVSVPYEVRLQILEELWEGPVDIQNALEAFGWRMVDSFWKGMFPKDIVFEYYDLGRQDHGVDCLFLCLTGRRLLKSCHGLWNRRRIIRLLEKVKGRFLRRLEAEVFYSLIVLVPLPRWIEWNHPTCMQKI
ncbi:uncharacterized protein BJX67DRAFT_353204 [Aspergillus lucknowensis]|uniref:F-box domain-containing protein n=1 Tax=Aspergillus lucknowensis TaxID=176173 RepID=A0ABR4LRJ9_9EURO